MNVPQPIDFRFNELKQFCLENVETLPTGLGADHAGYPVFHEGQQKIWNGSAWTVPSAPLSAQNVLYVSPNFPNSAPYFSSVNAANVYAESQSWNIDDCLIHVHRGIYLGSVSIKYNVYCEAGVIFRGSPVNWHVELTTGNLYGHATFEHDGGTNNFVFITLPIQGASGYPRNRITFEFNDFVYINGNSYNNYRSAIDIHGELTGNLTIKANRIEGRIINTAYADARVLAECPYRVFVDANLVYAVDQGWGNPLFCIPAKMIVRTKEIRHSLVKQGDVYIHFEYCNIGKTDPGFVVDGGNLTLRNGRIDANHPNPVVVSRNARLITVDPSNEPKLTLEQISLKNSGICVGLTALQDNGVWYPVKAIIKNCTFESDYDYSISGNNTTYCVLKSEGGQNSANAGVYGVNMLVGFIDLDQNVEV